VNDSINANDPAKCGQLWRGPTVCQTADATIEDVRAVADFLIENASVVATCAGPAPRRGAAQREISGLTDAAIAALRGEIVYVGAAGALREHVDLQDGATRLDAGGGAVVPGFVDPHTHVVYAGDRREELRRRLSGATYAEIAAAGGGILATVEATRAASADDLARSARARLDEMLACGTTTCEAKSGYGLETESELKQLRAIRTLDAQHAIDIAATFLGAHEIPPDYRSRRADYVSLVIDAMIPRVAAEGLAEWCDVFCDEGVFTPAEALAILEAGRRSGLKPRIHADELARSGGSGVAARVGARSADHLIHAGEAEARALAAADVCAVLLPAAAFHLKLGRFAPARMLIDAGVPLALATDVNPGGGCSPSMPFVMALACFAMGMTLEEALIAATLNAAWSLDRAHVAGSLEPGKLMDAVVVNGHLAELLRVGAPAIRTVVKRGKVVWTPRV
jgi:imidazolonepropionase